MGEDMLVNGRQWLCTTAASICIVSCIVSLFTIAFIAIDRYLYICWNGWGGWVERCYVCLLHRIASISAGMTSTPCYWPAGGPSWPSFRRGWPGLVVTGLVWERWLSVAVTDRRGRRFDVGGRPGHRLAQSSWVVFPSLWHQDPQVSVGSLHIPSLRHPLHSALKCCS